MQSESSLPGSTNTGKQSTADDAPIGNRYEFDYEDPAINPGVTLSTLVTQHVTKRSVWTLCIALGAVIYIHALGRLTTAWVLASSGADPAWPWDRSEAIMGVQYGDPLPWVFGTLVFSRLADVHSRLMSSVVALLVFVIGSIMVAAASSVSTIVAGIIFHKVGSSGINLLITLIIADCTSLRWRGFALSWTYFPFVINMWVAPRISNDVNWRWAYGMFVIMIPTICIPALAILFLTRYRQQANIPKASRTKLVRGLMKMDPLGLLLFTTGFALTIYGLGYWWESKTEHSPRIMLAIGLVLLFPCFLTWEFLYAPFPLITKDTVSTRAVKCAILAIFCFELASSLSFLGSSRVLVGGQWTIGLITWMSNSLSLAWAIFGPIFGVIFLLARRYKLPLLIANGLLILGAGLLVQCTRVLNPPDSFPSAGLIFAAEIIMGIGTAGTGLGLAIVSQASVSHDNLANVIALMIMASSLGDVISQPIATAIEYYSTASEHASAVIVATLVLTFALFSFILSLPMPDYVLGPDHNAVEVEGVHRSDPEEAGLTT